MGMITVTDKNRDDILDKYCDHIIETMDMQRIIEIAYDSIRDSRDLMSNESLEDEIKEFYPEILAEWCKFFIVNTLREPIDMVYWGEEVVKWFILLYAV